MTKAEAGKLGGKKTLEKHGREHFQEAGRKGAQATWSKYILIPVGFTMFAMVDRETGHEVARHS